ncbi:MAG: ABC transporter permease [Bryobacteraceae bacterium]
METLIRDIRYALRTMAKSPGFAAVAIISLALGIGANTTIYSWVKSILLRPLPGVRDVDRLVMLIERSRAGVFNSTSYPDLADFREAVSSKADLATYSMQTVGLNSGGRTDRAWSESVSANYFTVLGVQPVLGRGFLPEEDLKPGGAPVVVLSHHIWVNRFRSDPHIIGKTVILNSRSFTVAGVAPEEFHGSFVGLSTDLWTPVMMHAALFGSRPDLLNQRGNHWLLVFARPKPGVSVKQAEDALRAAANELGRRYPATNAGRTLSLVPIWKAPFGATSIFRPVLMVLTLVVGLVLLIACANVANLFLARALGRRKEIAIRLAVGGNRRRLIRQLLTESILLALMGGAAGLVVVEWATRLLRTLTPPANLPVHTIVETDASVLLFALFISIFTGLLFGLTPALQASNPNLVTTLKDDAVRLGGAPGHARTRSVLVIGQVALSLVLLIGAALFVEALNTAKRIDPGFDPNHVLAARFDLQPLNYSQERGRAFQKDLLERVRAIPGIESASYIRRLPLGFTGGTSSAMTIGGYVPKPDEEVVIDVNWAGPGYFHTMRTPILRGRDFDASDEMAAPRRVVINEAMARRYWAGRDPLGGRIRFGGVECQVIGVAKTGKYHSLGEEPLPYVFLPLPQFYKSDAVLLVRAAGDPRAYAAPVRAIVRAMDPSLALFDVTALTDYMSVPLFPSRTAASFLALLGLLALALATVGLYSVIAYAVAQRTREIGIRVALGAQRRDVLSLVARQGLFLTSAGVLLGLAGATGATRFARSMLYGVNPADPLTYFGLAAALYLAAMLACVVPAYRAAHVDPVVALRQQ